MNDYYSLVVAGTSFASSFFLKKYLQKAPKNSKVLVIERGQYLTHAKRLEYARNQAYGQNTFISSLSGLNSTFDNTESTKPWIFDPNFGGSSNCWTGCTPRFMPNDFNLFSKYGVGIDWPISYQDLETYYSEVEDIMQISGPEVTPYPKSGKYPLPPHSLSSVDKILQKEYGPLYISQPTARASVATGERGACCSTSICHMCPVNAKFTIENTLKSIYEDERVSLLLESQVQSLDLQNDKVSGINYIQNGKEKTVNAELFALGTNAIFNAHILLNSGDNHPLTGKGLSEQLGIYAFIYLNGLNNLGGSSSITANGFMLYDGEHRKERAACLIENHNNPFIRNEAGKWRQMAKMKFVFEDLPQNNNQVNTSDNPAIPKVKFQEYSSYAQKGIQHLKDNIEGLFSCLPVEKIEIDETPQPTEAHILGTARMGKTAAEGVVDSQLIHQKYRNLFILGGSSFPSITAANPTLTISALSLRSADLTI